MLHARPAWSTLRRLIDERERKNLLTEAGWRVLQVTWADVTERPEETAIRIRRMLATPILDQ